MVASLFQQQQLRHHHYVDIFLSRCPSKGEVKEASHPQVHFVREETSREKNTTVTSEQTVPTDTDMNPIVRACYPHDFPGFSGVTEPRKFHGMFGALFGTIVGEIERVINGTIEIRARNDGIGKLVNSSSGMYDGCIGRLQRNQSDLMLQLSDYPLPVSHLDQGFVMMDTVIQFIAAYTAPTEEETDAVQIESLFDSFDRYVWLLCLLSVIACYSCLLLGRCVSSIATQLGEETSEESSEALNYRRPLYQVITHMTAYGEIAATHSASAKILYLTASLFPLLVIFYLCSFIKTELVAVRAPDTLRSYRDLLDKNVSLAFNVGADSKFHFENAPEGSEERQLWDASVKRYPKMDFIIRINLQFEWLFRRLARREIALVLNSAFTRFFVRPLCRMCIQESGRDMIAAAVGLPNLRARTLFPLSAQDPNARSKLKGIIFSGSINRHIHKKLRHAATIFFENGLASRIMEIILDADVSAAEVDNDIRTRGLIDDCIANALYQPDMKVDAVGLSNFHNLTVILMMLYLIPFYFLICEKSMAKKLNHL